MSDALPPAASGVRLNDAQRLDWLRLIRSESVGPPTFRALINRFTSAGAALDGLPGVAAQRGKSLRIASREDAEREMEALTKIGAHLLAVGEPDYPATLRAIDAAPPLIGGIRCPPQKATRFQPIDDP